MVEWPNMLQNVKCFVDFKRWDLSTKAIAHVLCFCVIYLIDSFNCHIKVIIVYNIVEFHSEIDTFCYYCLRS